LQPTIRLQIDFHLDEIDFQESLNMLWS